MGEVEIVLPLGHMVGIFVAEREAEADGAALGVDQVEARDFRFLAAIERAAALDPKTLPRLERERGRPTSAAVLDLLKVLLKAVADAERVAPKIIASSATRLAVAPAWMPMGWPMVPPPNWSTTSSPNRSSS